VAVAKDEPARSSGRYASAPVARALVIAGIARLPTAVPDCEVIRGS
jgi:hypothetical protein